MATNNVVNTANPSGVTPASYTNVNLTVNAAGIITTASNGTGGSAAIYASVYPSATQTISTIAQLQYDTVTFDSNSFWNTGTYQYLPSVAGYYGVTLINTVITASSTDVITINIYKNGSPYSAYTFEYSITSKTWAITLCDVVYLNGSTDYISFYASAAVSSVFSQGAAIDSFALITYLGN